jgi:hypothetical protein
MEDNPISFRNTRAGFPTASAYGGTFETTMLLAPILIHLTVTSSPQFRTESQMSRRPIPAAKRGSEAVQGVRHALWNRGRVEQISSR